jgi:hypothetical protein
VIPALRVVHEEKFVDSVLLNNTEYVLVGMLFQVRLIFPGCPVTAMMLGTLNLTERSSTSYNAGRLRGATGSGKNLELGRAERDLDALKFGIKR